MIRLNRSLLALLTASAAAFGGELEAARDRQDRATLEKMSAELDAAAQKKSADAPAQYRAALAYSYLAEVAQEMRDKGGAKRAAETGIQAAQRALALKPQDAEYNRVLGTLYGQVIPANVLAGLSYGKRSQEAIAKAIERDPRSARNYVARGVGNYYLPPALGGGVDLAIKDFQKAVELDAKSDEAHMWLGIALRKANRNAEARKELARAAELNPNRAWIKQQLEKTPAN